MNATEQYIKPDWKDAPEWAWHRCMNRFGQWYWCENKPVPNETGYDFTGRNEISSSRDQPLVFRENWQGTLEARP
jgi:hypothetical protein